VRRRVVFGVLLSLLLAQSALADGDPASDVLAPPEVRVYMTVTASGPQLEDKLAATTEQVGAAGLPIKVAIIADRSDLGAVPQLWAKPQTYARFLGAELRLNFGGTLLVVMPQGFGIDGPYPEPRALAALSGIDPRKNPTPQGLTDAADQGVRALATAAGYKLSSSSAGGGAGLPLPLIAAGILVLAGLGSRVVLLRGRRAGRAGAR
jgi:hypothetical protein